MIHVKAKQTKKTNIFCLLTPKKKISGFKLDKYVPGPRVLTVNVVCLPGLVGTIDWDSQGVLTPHIAPNKN